MDTEEGKQGALPCEKLMNELHPRSQEFKRAGKDLALELGRASMWVPWCWAHCEQRENHAPPCADYWERIGIASP